MSSSSHVSLEMMKESGISGAGLSVRQGNIASRRAPRDQMSTLRLQYEQTEIFISLKLNYFHLIRLRNLLVPSLLLSRESAHSGAR